MKIEFEVNDIQDVDYIIGLLCYGVLSTLSKGNITTYDLGGVIFAPKMFKKLEEAGCNKKLIEMILSGCLLEDIEDVLPDNYYSAIESVKDLALQLINDIPKKPDPILKLSITK